LFAEDENSFMKRWANKIVDSSIGEMGVISSKLGQFFKYILSKKSEWITGQDQNMPGTRELEDITEGLLGIAEMATRGDEDLMETKTSKQIEREQEQDERAIKRLIRGSLSLGGRGYQNVYDWGELIYDTATKEEESGIDADL